MSDAQSGGSFWEIASTLSLWAAVFVALFAERLWKWVERPKLTLGRAPAQLGVHKTEASFKRALDGARGTVPCYYCHLEIANEGLGAARDVEVFLSGVYRFREGIWVVEERFIPEWLLWVTIRNVAGTGIYLPTLPPNARRYVDLAHVHQPGTRGLFRGETRRDAQEDRTLLSLDVAVTYLRAGHLLDPGRYKLTLEVAAANAAPRAFEVEIEHSGDWLEREDEMRERGLIIGGVRPISGEAVQVLAEQGVRE